MHPLVALYQHIVCVCVCVCVCVWVCVCAYSIGTFLRGFIFCASYLWTDGKPCISGSEYYCLAYLKDLERLGHCRVYTESIH